MNRFNRRPPNRRQSGQALIEYAVVTLLAVIVLVASPNVIVELVDSIKQAYSAFVFAISQSWI